MLSHFKSKKNLVKSIIKTLHTRRLFLRVEWSRHFVDHSRKTTPPIHIKKSSTHTRVLLLGMVIVNKKAIKDPKVHFRGKEIY